ncbi:MAG: porin, partial [Candidatus Competibacteraceae bacterium]|nr:porin [Candidatus Competibacteraceae bacterium]
NLQSGEDEFGGDECDEVGELFDTCEIQGDQFGAAVGWTGETLAATLTYEGVEPDVDFDFDLQDDDDDDFDVDADSIYATVSYSFGANIVRASYGLTSFDSDDGETEFDSFGVGFQHNLSARTRVWVEYFGERFGDFDFDLEDIGDTGFDESDLDNNQVSIGVRHDF